MPTPNNGVIIALTGALFLWAIARSSSKTPRTKPRATSADSSKTTSGRPEPTTSATDPLSKNSKRKHSTPKRKNRTRYSLENFNPPMPPIGSLIALGGMLFVWAIGLLLVDNQASCNSFDASQMSPLFRELAKFGFVCWLFQ